MANLAEAIRRWALEDGASNPAIELDEGGNHARHAFSVEIEGERFPAWFDANEEQGWLGLSLYAADTVPEARRSAVAELLTWINDDRLNVGNFETSPEKGEIRYRAALSMAPKRVVPEMLARLVESGMRAMARSLPAIRAVAFAGVSPRLEACGEDEGSTRGFEKVDADATPPWSSFFGAEVIQAWVGEIKEALAAGAAVERWRLTGRAIVIEHDYPGSGPILARRIAADCGLPLGILDGEDMASVPGAAVLECSAPLVLYLGAGDWQQRSDKNDLDEAALDAQRRVQDLLHDFNPARPIVCVTVASAVSDMAPSLRQAGAFDRWLTLPTPPHTFVGEDLLDRVGRERCSAALLEEAAKIGKLLSYSYDSPEQRELMALSLRRLHARAGRLLAFHDLVELEAHNLTEARAIGKTGDAQRYIAYHEAGHAAMAYLDSSGRDIPEYSSIVPHGNSNGVVVDSISYACTREGRYSYDDFRHDIRTTLAGRAAEEIAFGTHGISRGASADLESCTRKAWRAFAEWGFSPEMEGADGSAGNLAVIVGKPSPSEMAHVEELVRRFLAREYGVALSALARNRGLLDAITDRLQSDAVLDQSELAAICHLHMIVQ